jgi:hypothetical protein
MIEQRGGGFQNIFRRMLAVSVGGHGAGEFLAVGEQPGERGLQRRALTAVYVVPQQHRARAGFRGGEVRRALRTAPVVHHHDPRRRRRGHRAHRLHQFWPRLIRGDDDRNLHRLLSG